jgi:SAM-dependent methyltransferase
VIGFLTKQAGRYGLTPDAATFLDRRSPAYTGGAIEFLNSPQLMDSFRNLAAVVRQGGTIQPAEGTLAPEHPVWVEFARAMAPMMAMPAEMAARLVLSSGGKVTRVLDIAASHGLYGLAFARQSPGTEVVALDWPNVLQVARENAERAGVSGRFRTIPGSAFEVDFAGPYDVILLPNFLHHFDPPTCEGLLSKVRAALAPGGRAVTLEFIPNEDRVTPPSAATFALTMLGTTPAGDAYTYREYESMFRNAGFSRSELHELPPSPSRVVISHP